MEPTCFPSAAHGLLHLFFDLASGQGRGFETFLNGRLTPSPMIQTPALGPRYSPGDHTNKGTVLASRSTPEPLLPSSEGQRLTEERRTITLLTAVALESRDLRFSKNSNPGMLFLG